MSRIDTANLMNYEQARKRAEDIYVSVTLPAAFSIEECDRFCTAYLQGYLEAMEDLSGTPHKDYSEEDCND